MKIGCVADDFTGASDIASFLTEQGYRTILMNGIGKNIETIYSAADACVIALKTRSCETHIAIEKTINAFSMLKAAGAEKLYFKYCSTFDSTKKGNIGPVLDAILDKFKLKYTLICPSLPVNGRTVKNGRIYVYGVPLDESSMRNHPLNPMWSSDICELMKEQSKNRVIPLSIEIMSQGKKAVEEYITLETENLEHYYIVPDFYEESHAEIIMDLFGNISFLSGGSGLVSAFPKKDKKIDCNLFNDGDVKHTVIISGSCSDATNRQIEKYIRDNYSTYKIEPEKIDLYDTNTAARIWNEVRGVNRVAIYSTKRLNGTNTFYCSGMLEKLMAEIASLALNDNCTQIIVAGGETAGSVTQKLGFTSFYVGESVDPGVPVLCPLERESVRMVLKSGNFGDDNFFEEAVKKSEKR